jgi:hypothetical protein
VSDCTGWRNTQVLFMLTELLWDHKFLSDVTGCWKTRVSDCTGSTVYIYHILTYNMYDFAYAIQMVMVSPYHSPCNNNATSHGGVIRHYYYMDCDMAKTKWCL